MKTTILIILAFLFAGSLFGQSKVEKETVKEGKKLYKREMASWYGTDLFIEKFADKQSNAGGYFSYTKDDRAVCVFFSKGSSPKILASFSFDSTYSLNRAIVDGRERGLSELESSLFTIRQTALNALMTDTLFKFYEDMSPNLIPLDDEEGKRVYILTGRKRMEL